MSDARRLLYLRIALIVIGLLCFALYPLGLVWPSGWTWGHGHSHYLMMIVGIYATLGVFLLIAARNPHAHKDMGAQSLSDAGEHGHLIGDVPALVLVAVVLAALMPRGNQENAA
ncbi:MAG: DUF6632 domain-containing protein [Pseudolabrys sp.]|jgi:hypothetical protein